MVSWRAGVVYKPRENGSIYVGYGIVLQSVGGRSGADRRHRALEPEKTRTYEVGTKWDVAGERLSLTGALFRTEKTNARTPGINPGDPPTVLAGEQLVQRPRARRVRTAHPTLVGVRRATRFMHSDIAASNTRGRGRQRAGADAGAHVQPLDHVRAAVGRSTVGGGAQYMDAVFRNATNTARCPATGWSTRSRPTR